MRRTLHGYLLWELGCRFPKLQFALQRGIDLSYSLTVRRGSESWTIKHGTYTRLCLESLKQIAQLTGEQAQEVF